MLAHGVDYVSPAHQKCKLLIMTSHVNHEETVGFFKENDYFGARPDSLLFFPQATLPCIDDKSGKILMKSASEL
jgi:UDP-N-acetylglucosamine/UDP-N-acetylgalactosamine diphosphorylase